MLTHALTPLCRLVAWLSWRSPPALAAPVPLDPIERLQQHGGGLPLMLEFARTGW